MASKPTQRTLALLRKIGWSPAVVEKWIPQARRRKDLYGCIDLVAIHEDSPGVLGVQATSYSNVASRVRKALEEEILPVWLKAGNRFVVTGWRNRRKGRRKWWPRSREITLQGGELIVGDMMGANVYSLPGRTFSL